MRDYRADFAAAFPKALQALETAVQQLLLSGGWEESARCCAHEIAIALTRAAKDAHWWETEGVLRPVVGLLALSPREALPIRDHVGAKLLELLALLKNHSAARSA